MQTSMISVLGSEELASKLGKKGSATDITMYNHKVGTRTLTAVSPTRYPEKLSPLLYALYLGDEVIMLVDRLDRTVGEAMVACDVLGKTRGRIILVNYIQPDQILPLIRGTTLENWDLVEGLENPNLLREELMAREMAVRDGTTRVTVDQTFAVRGVGTVSLGLVDSGAVSRHQELVALPTGKRTIVRSIQVHDEDVESAPSGSRVGLALKLVEVDDVGRGSILAPRDTLRVVDRLRMRLRVSRFWKDHLPDGMVVHLALGMQFVPGRVSMGNGGLRGGDEGELEVDLEGRLVVGDGDQPVITWLESTGPRILGRGEILPSS